MRISITLVYIIIVLMLISCELGGSHKAITSNYSKNNAAYILDMDSVLLKKLCEIRIDSFIHRPVDLLLKDSNVSKYSDYIFIDEKPGSLSFLALKYSPDLYVAVYTNEYNYIKQFDINMSWKLEEYRKEDLSRVKIFFKNKLFKELPPTGTSASDLSE